MCGWGILVHRDGRRVESRQLQAMADAVAHRGPDAEGLVELGAVGLAHRRLAVIDVHDRSNQPMRFGDNWLLFNGAIYNFRDIQRELEALGHEFHTRSDTEVLLHALSEWGSDALPRLNGMFSFAFYNAKQGKLLLARDRFGIKPLCYHLSDQVLIAGSEAKQLLATGLVSSRPNRAAARIFLETGRLNVDDRTLFADIANLPPGHWLEVDTKSWETRRQRWYDLAQRIAPSRPAYGEAVATIRDLLADAVRLRHIANVPIGSALSGGLDSTSMAVFSRAVVADPAAHPVFTTYHDEQGHDERQLAASVANKLGYRHVEVPVDLPSYFTTDWLERFARLQDQPLPSGSHFNEYALFEAARGHGVTVFLDGQGADEYFGGYGEYWSAAQRGALRSGRFDEVWRNLRGRSLTTGDPLGLTFRKWVARQLGVVPLVSELMDGAFSQEIQGTVEAEELLPRDFKALVLAEMGRLSIPYQLHSQDRFAMAFGVESRLPFLDYRLVEYVSSLPVTYRVGGGWQKRILRDAMHELPDAVRWRRQKNGFSSPDAGYWATNNDRMRSMVHDALDTLAPLVDVRLVRQRLDASAATIADYDQAMFRLISLAAWVRAFDVSL